MYNETMAFKISNFVLLVGAALTTRKMRSQEIIEVILEYLWTSLQLGFSSVFTLYFLDSVENVQSRPHLATGVTDPVVPGPSHPSDLELYHQDYKP